MEFCNKMIFLCLLLISVGVLNATPRGDYGLYGPRPCDCMITFDYSPVCASNGQTFPNSGALACKNECDNFNLRLVHHGECRKRQSGFRYNRGASRPCNCAVTLDYSPVCGSDRQTYSNSGKLDCDNRCYGTNIYVVHGGEC